MGRRTNGELLALAAGEFDVFLTVDRNLSYRQDVSAVDIAVLVLVARGNTLDVLRPLVPLVLNALMNPQRGAVTLIRQWGEPGEYAKMKTLTEAAFLAWADGAGLCLDPQYPKSAVLVFRPDRNVGFSPTMPLRLRNAQDNGISDEDWVVVSVEGWPLSRCRFGGLRTQRFLHV